MTPLLFTRSRRYSTVPTGEDPFRRTWKGRRDASKPAHRSAGRRLRPAPLQGNNAKILERRRHANNPDGMRLSTVLSPDKSQRRRRRRRGVERVVGGSISLRHSLDPTPALATVCRRPMPGGTDHNHERVLSSDSSAQRKRVFLTASLTKARFHESGCHRRHAVKVDTSRIWPPRCIGDGMRLLHIIETYNSVKGNDDPTWPRSPLSGGNSFHADGFQHAAHGRHPDFR